jgi:hypothetical protein
MEIRAAGTSAAGSEFWGLACRTDAGYEMWDWAGHLALTETGDGLECLAPELDLEDTDVAYIARKIRSGLVTEMSFKFRIIRGQWSPDWTEYHIQEADIHRGDVAICGYGANPNTIAEMRTPALTEVLAGASEAEQRAAYADLAARFAAAPARRSLCVLDSDLR